MLIHFVNSNFIYENCEWNTFDKCSLLFLVKQVISKYIYDICSVIYIYISNSWLKLNFYFLLPVVWYTKHCFWVKLLKLRFWWIYTFWGLLNLKNYIFRSVSFRLINLRTGEHRRIQMYKVFMLIVPLLNCC